MRRLRRVIAIILAVCMAMGLYRVDVHADEIDESQSYQQSEEASEDNASDTDADISETVTDEENTEAIQVEELKESPEAVSAESPKKAEEDEKQAETSEDVEEQPEKTALRKRSVDSKNPVPPVESELNQDVGRLTFEDAVDCGGQAVYFELSDDEEYVLYLEYMPEGAEDFIPLYVDMDDDDVVVSDEIPFGIPVKFTIIYPDRGEYIPFINIDGEYNVFNENQYVWENDFSDEKHFEDISLTEPVETVEVDDMTIFEGRYESRDIWEEDQIVGSYQGYRTWPNYISVKLVNGEVFEGEPNDVKHALAEYFSINPDHLNYREYAEQPYEGDPEVTTWTAGNSYNADFCVLGAYTSYSISIAENPVKTVVVSDITRFEGDTSVRERWQDDEVVGFETVYDTWPENVYLELTDGTEFRGNGGDVKRELADYLGIKEYQLEFNDEFNQPLDENYKTTWGCGEYTGSLNVLGKTGEYKVKIVESPIEDIEVGDLSVAAGDYEYRDEWRDNPETGERERVVLKAYRTWPRYIKITLTDEFDVDPIEGDPDEVKRQLAGIMNYDNPDQLPFGENGWEVQTYDENGISEWQSGEKYEVTFRTLGAETSYLVSVVDGVPIASITQPDIMKYVGDVNEMRGYDYVDEAGNHQFEDIVWYGYDVYPHNLEVTFTDGSEPITGDCWSIRDEIYRKYNVWLNDRIEGNTQTPYEGGSWSEGIYDIKFHLGTFAAEYKMIIEENPIKEYTVGNITRYEGDMREERGYRNPENGQWIDDATFMIYDPWPDTVSVTLSESYAEKYGNAKIEGDGEYVRKELMSLLEIEDEREFDFGWETDQTPDNVWGIGDHTAEFSIAGIKTQYTVSIIENPIKSVTIEPQIVVAGSTFIEHGWYGGDNDMPDVEWERYDTWPHKVKVEFKDDSDPLYGDPNSFRDALSEKLGMEPEYRHNDTQRPVEIEGKYVSDWEVGKQYDASFTILGMGGTYKVSVMDSPIESIEVPENVYKWIGDTYEEHGWWGSADSNPDLIWERYGSWPSEINVKLYDREEPIILTGDYDEMTATLADELDIDQEDIFIEIRDDQKPDVNGITNWGKGEHTAEVKIAGKTAQFKVIVVDPEIQKMEIETVYRDYEDIVPMGYEDPDTHEWIPYEDMSEDDKFEGYNFFPERILVTYENGDTAEIDDPFAFADELRDEYNVPENYGIHVYVTSDQHPNEDGETNWEIGYHSATLEFGTLKTNYDVVITGVKGNYTGLAPDTDYGDNYYYFVDGFIVDNFSGFLQTVVAKSIGRLGEDTELLEGSEGWWWLEDGEVDLENGPIMAEGFINDTKAVYKLKDGKFDPTFTGFADEDEKSYYFSNGIFTVVETIAYDSRDKKWYYVKDGIKNLEFTGIAKATNGKWYFCRDGVRDLTYNGLAQATNGIWYYCSKGKIDRTFTGKIAPTVEGKLYYVNKGKPTKNFDGKIAFCPADGNWYYCTNGRPDAKFSGKIAYCTNGDWYYVTKGKINKKFTGVAEATNGTWYFCSKGKLNKEFTGVSKDTNGNYKYVSAGKYNTKYKGLAKLSSGGTTLYYVAGGTIDRTFNGTCKYEGKTYKVVKGVAKQ